MASDAVRYNVETDLEEHEEADPLSWKMQVHSLYHIYPI